MRRLSRSGAVGLGLALALAPAAARAEDKDVEMLRKGVGYLVKAQNENGSWGELPGAKEKGELGFTALVVLGLARFHGPWADADTGALSAMIAKAKESGATWIAGKQQKDGSFSHPENPGLVTYRTSLAVIALHAVDAEKHKEHVAKAVEWLKKAQFDEEDATPVKPDSPHYGGWGYDKTGEKPDADLSNSHFALQALKEAGVSPDDPVWKRAMEFVSRCQNNPETNKGISGVLKPKSDGGLFYGPSRGQSAEDKADDGARSYESYASMTYAGLVSFIYAGVGKDDPRVKAALGWIKEHYTLEENYGLGVRKDAKAAQQGLFYYYLAFAKALAAAGETEVETAKGKRPWARDLLDVLASKQKPDGSWVNENSQRWMEGNPLLATAYAVNAIDIALAHRPKGEK